ncbi:MAG: hypothetical protein IJ189_05950 [Clostridia bacterium]|nr:hypothetical protein [Clostridia bacterium]
MPQKAMGTKISCTFNKQETTIGCLRSISEIKADSDAIDVTTLDAADGCKTYIQGYKDLGEVTIEGFHDKGNDGQTLLRSLYQSGQAVPFTVTFPDTSAVSFTAFVKSHALGAASVDGAVGFTAVLRLTGGVTLK